MRYFVRLMLVFALGVIQLSFAQSTQSTDKIKAELQKQFGQNIQIKSITPSPIVGIFEVIANNSVVYVDAQAKFLIQGSIVDLKNGANITEAREEELHRIAFNTLPLKDAITYVKGDGSRKVAVFADPNCGYCKALEKTFQTMDNLTVYTFLIPILAADSATKSKAIWCSAEPSKTWVNWMVSQTALPSKTDCATPLERNLDLAKKLGINGTPALFFTDGNRIPGAASKDDIEKKFASLNKSMVK
jgi:thiol:disulfide interchange protein DsbC